ncbi:MAG: flagellar protein FlgN [Candidatus Hydrogenedentes bacterium]|nr:flagellar protein FlgN [Candidatus Hydrogenedentota bacterium]
MAVDSNINTLCQLLEDEIERQENLLSVCRSQHEALLAQDLETLQARTEALEALVRETAQAHAMRNSIVQPILAKGGISNANPCLSDLIEAVPVEWKGRLRDLQTRLKAAIAANRTVVRTNARMLRQSLNVTEQLLDTFQACSEGLAGNYTEQGGGTTVRLIEPVMLDHRG